ncbi:MAG TPA: transketolase C-terminal domain-containing protein [Solirubrobacterales bacterium]|nr:transketolase C-terminal domain-containing protein [Solirubrobacterales bacterium]
MSEQIQTAPNADAIAEEQRKAGPFARALDRYAEQHEDVIGVTADLSKTTDMNLFRERFPERFVNVGMAEQSLVSVASGLEMAGYRPIATTFAVFLARRALDFVAMQISLHSANVTVVGGLGGLCSTFGPSHQGIDDIAHMRAMPNMVVIDPCDPVEMEQATIAALEHEGPVYLRQLLGKEPVVLDRETHEFEIGKAVRLREGSDLGIVASSIMVKHALDAAEELAAEGIEAAVLKVSTPKPFDGDAVAELMAECGALVTAENHLLAGGLFSCVSEALALRGLGGRVVPVGMRDEYGSFGTLEYNKVQHGMETKSVLTAARAALDDGATQ